MKRFCALMLAFLLPAAAAQAATLYSSVRNGIDLFEKQQYEEALQTFLAAQVEHPESALLKFDIASCQYKLGRYEEAAAGYRDVAAGAQDARLEAHAHYNLGNAMYRQGKLEEAAEYYKKALELDPDDEDARRNLEFVREEIKRRQNEARDTEQRQQEGCKNPQTDPSGDRQDQQKSDQEAEPEDRENSVQDAQPEEPQESRQDGHPESQEQEDSSAGGADEQTQEQERASGTGREDGARQAEEDLSDIGDDVRPMSEQEAEQWLKGLEENRDKLMQHRQKMQPGRPRRPAKDW